MTPSPTSRLTCRGTGRLEPEISVGSNPVSVHQDADSTLMSFRIEVIESHHIDSLVAEIPFRDHLEVLGAQGLRHHESGQTGHTEILE